LCFIFATASFEFLQSTLNEEASKCGSVHIFFFLQKHAMVPAHFAGKTSANCQKNIIAVKPIVLSVLTDRNVCHGNICCHLLVNNALGHVGIQAYS